MKRENNIKQGMCHFFLGGNLQLNNEQAILRRLQKVEVLAAMCSSRTDEFTEYVYTPETFL